MKKVFLFYIALAFIAFTQVQAQQTKRIYQIGNSVTDGINYDGFKNMALSQGNTHIWARHMIPGAPLGMLWDERFETGPFTVAPYYGPGHAFPNHDWDVVTLQPFDRGVEDDKTAMLNYANIIKDKSPDVQFYIYSRYPGVPSGQGSTVDGNYVITATADDWADLWDNNYTGPGAGSQKHMEKRIFFEELFTAYNATNKGGLNKDALIIPVGDVMYAFNAKAKVGDVPGFSSVWGIYDDGIHVNNIGSYIIMGTFYSTIYKEDIRGTAAPANYGSIDPEVLAVIQQAIYEVVFTHPYSGATLDDLIPVSGVTLDRENLSMSVFNREQLTATVLPGNAAKKGVIWSSSDTGVAIVDQKGRVTSVSEGETTITVTTFDGDFTDECVVTVSGIANGTTQSGTIARWNFNGQNSQANNEQPASTTIEGISETIASVGEGLYVDTWENSLCGSGQTTMDLVSSISDGEYISFKITAEKGEMISISKIQFTPFSQNIVRSFILFSNINGFTNGKELFSCERSGGEELFTADITGHNHLNEVEFRVYTYAHSAPGDLSYQSAGIGTDNSGNSFVITGSIFTPENDAPSTPGNIRAIEVKDTYINFEWDESTDDYFVKGYNFYLGDVKINDEPIETTSFMLEGLTSGQLCEVSVEAVDFFDLTSETKGTFSIYANRPPVAVITPSVTSGKVPLTVAFTSNASTDPDEDEGDYVLGFDWYVNGEILSDNGNTLPYTFTQRGDYEVGLIVMDSRGMRSTEMSKTTITITADKYAINVTGGATTPVTDEAFFGDEVTIIANEPNEGMEFDKWTSGDVEFADETSETTTFTMPAKDVTIEAVFTPIISIEQGNTDKVTIYPNPAGEYIAITGIADAAYIITNVAGTSVQSGTLNGEPLFIGSLERGFYLITIGAHTLTFIKE